MWICTASCLKLEVEKKGISISPSLKAFYVCAVCLVNVTELQREITNPVELRWFWFCRMTAYFNKTGWPEKAPSDEEERKQFIASLHKRKTELFMALIEKKLLPLRPGVAKLVIIWTSFSMQYWYLGLIITYNSTVYALASQLVGNTHRSFDQVQTSVLLSWWLMNVLCCLQSQWLITLRFLCSSPSVVCFKSINVNWLSHTLPLPHTSIQQLSLGKILWR